MLHVVLQCNVTPSCARGSPRDTSSSSFPVFSTEWFINAATIQPCADIITRTMQWVVRWAIFALLWLFCCRIFLDTRYLQLSSLLVVALDFAFDVYDFKGNGEVDAFYTGDLLRACNLNPTLKTIAEIGGEKEKGKRMLKKVDCYPIYKACKESKDQGGFHDFVEILKLYDKNEDNTILSHQLYLLLTNLGEKLNKEEAKSLMKELCEPDDDDGFTPFIRKCLVYSVLTQDLFDRHNFIYLIILV